MFAVVRHPAHNKKLQLLHYSNYIEGSQEPRTDCVFGSKTSCPQSIITHIFKHAIDCHKPVLKFCLHKTKNVSGNVFFRILKIGLSNCIFSPFVILITSVDFYFIYPLSWVELKLAIARCVLGVKPLPNQTHRAEVFKNMKLSKRSFQFQKFRLYRSQG